MNGTINVFIPRTADGERMTGPVPKHRIAYPRSIDVRTYFDPLADRNLPNSIPVAPKAKPVPKYAPKGWSLRPLDTPVSRAPADLQVVVPEVKSIPTVEVPTVPASQLASMHCGKRFRTPSGFAWHLRNVHAGMAA
jgi:hypothetical protein